LRWTPGGPIRPSPISHLTTALEGETKIVEAYRELGLAYYKKRDKARAIHAFEQYLKVAPTAHDAGRIKKSIEELKRS
jgi:regulator of sirC expression with transglutaminase-like and TPR domain